MDTGFRTLRGGRRTVLCILLALAVSVGSLHAFFLPVNAEQEAAAGSFAYLHDPSANPEAMKDIERDDAAVYGFRPSETGNLKQYASADWSDPEIVEAGRQERIAYHDSIESMYSLLGQLRGEGRSVEEIARAVSAKRNEIRLESYRDDPEGLATLKQRNLEKYGHEEGPLPDELFEQYGSWETVLLKAFSPNVGMDACLGLYDDYYETYVFLGLAEEDAGIPPKTGDAGIGIWLLLLFGSAAGLIPRRIRTRSA